jgi:hypothetical protein
LVAGDPVLLVFAERSLENWLNSGEVSAAPDYSRFALKDAIAIPGIRSKGNPITPNGAATSAEFALGTTAIELTAAGKVKIGTPAVELLTQLVSLLTQLVSPANIQVVPATGTGTFSPAVLVQLNIIKIALEALKA